MSDHFGDKLVEAVESRGVPACVGLDPLIERLPPSVLSEAGLSPRPSAEVSAMPAEAVADALGTYGRGVIDAVAPFVPVVKMNIAFFERHHLAGFRIYSELIGYARRAGLLVIGDIKRADIGHSASQYARAYLQPYSDGVPADAVTVNPYFGLDGVRPFIEQAREQGRGLFVLVQTSNESAHQVQGLTFDDGETVCHRVARLVEGWAGDPSLMGRRGYSCVGAVVSPRDVSSTRVIRALMPSCIFLVPGFGAQGRTTEEIRHCFKPDGTGALVSASRSVIYAYQEARYRDRGEGDWRQCIQEACKDFADAVRETTSGR